MFAKAWPFIKGVLIRYQERHYVETISRTGYLINPANGPVQYLKIAGGNHAIGLVPPGLRDTHESVVVYLECGGNTPTWAAPGGATIKWISDAAGAAPTLVTTAGKWNTITFTFCGYLNRVNAYFGGKET
jgi:hypothetical protein